MKKILWLCCAALFASCAREIPGGGLVWGSDTLSRSGTHDVVALIYPVAREGVASDSINRTLEYYLKQLFAGDSVAASDVTLAQAVDSLLAHKNRDTVTAHMPYQLYCEGSYYTKGFLTSVWLQTYAFTGGAHGLTLSKCFNFDNRTGELLPLEALVSDTARLSELNREAFRKFLAQQSFTQEEVDSYLFVKPDELPLPQNIGFDSTGVKMLYNPYEIAAYVFGQSEYAVPYDQAKAVLSKIARGK